MRCSVLELAGEARSIALGAMAALTRVKLVWFGSMVLGAAGIVLFTLQVLQ